MGHLVLKYWEYQLGTEVQEVSCSLCLVLEVKNGRIMEPTARPKTGQGAPTSPSSVITAAQSYPSGFASQQVMSPKVVPTVIVVISLYEYVGVRNRLKCPWGQSIILSLSLIVVNGIDYHFPLLSKWNHVNNPNPELQTQPGLSLFSLFALLSLEISVVQLL